MTVFFVKDILVNPTKSEVIAIGTATQSHITSSTSTVGVAGALLSFVDNICSLGVQIDSNLSFDAHVNAVLQIVQPSYLSSMTDPSQSVDRYC